MKKRETIKQTDLSNRREKRKDNKIKSDPHMLHLKQPQEGIISLLLSSDQDAECIILSRNSIVFASHLCWCALRNKISEAQDHTFTRKQPNRFCLSTLFM